MEGLFGIETEYAVAGMTTRGPVRRDEFIERIVALARQRLVHLPDLSSSAGVFLQNGSRFMIDQGLPEISTPECTHPTDVVRYVQAGHRILSGIAAAIEAESPPGTEIMCFRNNVDYGGTQSTWGSHESYSHTTSSETIREQIIPHRQWGLSSSCARSLLQSRAACGSSAACRRGQFHARQAYLS